MQAGSTGHTGRHPVTYYDTMLSGSSRMFRAGQLEAERVEAGTFLVTRPMEAFVAQVEDQVFFLECCRGKLFTLLPFGFVNFLSTFDLKSAAQITSTWLKLAWRSRGVRGTRPEVL